jgi:hypothetical protein
MKLKLTQIRVDGGTQPRVALRNDVIEDYAERMQAGIAFDPIAVFFDGSQYWLSDGFHRLAACLRAGIDTIEADILQGSLADAQWHSYSVNKSHGLRRTNEDKERAVKLAVAHPRAVDQSNMQIAEHCGVDEKTVRKYRLSNNISASSEIPKMRTVTRGETTYQQRTRNIGQHKKKKTKRRGPQPVSKKAAPPVLAHSVPNPMIALSLPPNNPVMAATTIFKLFDSQFVRALIAELSQRLKGQDDE